ncbi:S9 family peptidase [Microbulbifer litoralis]|uniref:S9 family peptidase n=1 Tax=Microbulbifer litoralis TaxID=2933965 RepID=UPI002029664F|nr:S9 family peptidase [Microbulbifer sp. GX H0434]
MHQLIRSIALMALALPALAATETPDFHYDDVFSLEYASDPQFDRDGETVFYVRNFMDKMADRRRSNLWRIDADGDNHRPLTAGNYSDHSPRLSPDGNVLAFVSDRSGKPQIHLLWLDNGRFLQISHLPRSPSNIQWSRDGSQLAFTMFVPESKPLPVKLPDKPEGAEWAEGPKFIDRATYRADGRGYLKQGHTQIFVIPREGGTPRQLTSGAFDHDSRLAWSEDGDTIYFSANRHPEHELEIMNSEIYKVSLVGGEIEPVTERFGPDFNPQISPDGEHLAYLGFEDQKLGYQNTGLRILDLESGQSRAVETAEDRSVSDFAWADNRHIAYSYDDSGSTRIALKRIGGGERILASDAGGLSLGRPYSGADFAVSARDEIVYTRTRGQQPAELALSRGGDVHQVTALNSDLVPFRNMAQIEEIQYKSAHDGREIQGWVAYPPGFDPQKKYPLLLEIHGGPFANYGPRFAAEIQLYAAAGYVVLYTNPRGSTSYGHEFANLIHHNYPSHDYDDLMSGVDALIDQGYIDRDRLYVTGGSGGGTLTAWIVGKTDRFRAAVVAKPVINWESFVLTADFSRFFVDYWFPGMPWEKPENYRRRSPLTYVGNITTPTMLLTGEQDYRTPISETEQFYQALKLQQVDTAMVRIPGASHGIAARPSQLIAKVASVLYWFDQHKPSGEEAKVAQNDGTTDM